MLILVHFMQFEGSFTVALARCLVNGNLFFNLLILASCYIWRFVFYLLLQDFVSLSI